MGFTVFVFFDFESYLNEENEQDILKYKIIKKKFNKIKLLLKTLITIKTINQLNLNG